MVAACCDGITKTTFHRSDYGDDFMNTLAERLYLEPSQGVDTIPCMRSVIMDPWVIETTSGKGNFNFFKEVFMPELRKAVIESVNELVSSTTQSKHDSGY